MKIGPGAPPIKTDRGWLSIYHGVFRTMDGSVYRTEPSEGHRSERLVDFAAGRSLGNHGICPQRRVHLWRRCGVRWNREDLLGRRRHGHVCGRSECLRAGRVMPGSRQTGKMSSFPILKMFLNVPRFFGVAPEQKTRNRAIGAGLSEFCALPRLRELR